MKALLAALLAVLFVAVATSPLFAEGDKSSFSQCRVRTRSAKVENTVGDLVDPESHPMVSRRTACDSCQEPVAAEKVATHPSGLR
jgi:hypothetical protein